MRRHVEKASRSRTSKKTDLSNNDIPAHVEYAAVHWVTHVTCAKGSKILANNVKAFCGESLLVWIEVLSLVGGLDVSVHGSISVRSWMQENCYVSATYIL